MMWISIRFVEPVSIWPYWLWQLTISNHMGVRPYATTVSSYLTHQGRMTIYASVNKAIIGSDNGLSPARCRATIWTNADISLINPPGTFFSAMLIGIQTFPLNKMQFKISSAKRRPFCLGLSVCSAASSLHTLFPFRLIPTLLVYITTRY